MLQIFILAAVALFLFWRLRAVLGSRDGFEKTIKQIKENSIQDKAPIEVGETPKESIDNDIFDYVEENSDIADVFKKMKDFDNQFSVNKFVSGAKSAYEIILMAFENGDINKLENLLEKKVFKSFMTVINKRKKDGLVVEARFIGMRDIRITNAYFNEKTKTADVTLTFKSEMSTVVKDRKGLVVEGNSDEIKKQKDTWVFTKNLEEKNPVWFLKSIL